MKLLKKLASFILAFAMVAAIAMPSVVMAAGNGSITITGAKEGHTFEAYQIFAGDYSNGTLSNIKWGEGVTSEGQTKLGSATEKADDLKNESDAKNFADEVSDYLTTPAGSANERDDSENYVISNLAPGYYLVKDKGPAAGLDSYSKFILLVVGDATSKVKNNVPESYKKVKDTNDTDGTTTDWQDSADYDIGDKVPFQLTGTVAEDYTSYKAAYQLVFHDTLSNGLTFDKDSVKVYKNDSDTKINSSEYEITCPGTDGHTFDVTIKNVKNLGDDVKKIRVEYEATLNTEAVIGSQGNPNEMYMDFSNNPNSTEGGEKGTTPNDKVIVFTYKTVINKVDKDEKALEGAAFKLEKKMKDGTTTIVKEFDVKQGQTSFEFKGLDDGDYILTETKTPDGYNTIDPIKFTITADHEENSDDPKLINLNGITDTGEVTFNGSTFTVSKSEGSLTTKVVNYKGSELPSTGGMGTTVLYVAGTLMIIAAAAFLVMKKKAENK